MTYQKIGPIEILMSENHSKVPYSSSLLIHGSDETALIDCGSGQNAFEYAKKQKLLRNIYLTHYHFDHVWGVREFPGANVWINPYDRDKLKDLKEMTIANGIYAMLGEEGSKKWVQKQLEANTHNYNKPNLHAVTKVDMNIYPYEQPLDMAGEKVIMLHAPGHAEGMALPYFPDQGVLFVVDYDLSSFGPWYMNSDSDIDGFVESALATLKVGAEYFITSHHKGVVTKKEYEPMLRDYLAIIEKREQKIIDAIKRGVSPEDIVYQEIFYLKSTYKKDPLSVLWERMGISKHLHRLAKTGSPYDDYYNQFITAHNIHKDYLVYKSFPQQANEHPLITKAHSR